MLSVRSFIACEAGAVTVDWVALTATTLLLGVAVVYSIYGNGFMSLVTSVNDSMQDIHTSGSGTKPEINTSAG